jgi:large subunit ribosomal protein L3
MPPRTLITSVVRPKNVQSVALRLFPIGRIQFSTSSSNAFGLRPKRVSSSGSPVLLEASRAAALARRQLPTRTGALAFKKGMTAVYEADGKRIPCTVLQLDRVQVTAVKDRKTHGYWAVQVGLGWRDPKNITRPMLGHYEACGVAPKKLLREFRVQNESGLMALGTQITADHFIVGQYVDVRANSKGKGFAGVCFPISSPTLSQPLLHKSYSLTTTKHTGYETVGMERSASITR